MPSIALDVLEETKGEFEVFCTCGNGMCSQTDIRYSWQRRFPQAVVTPCPFCLDKAHEEGYQQGYDDAVADMEKE